MHDSSLDQRRKGCMLGLTRVTGRGYDPSSSSTAKDLKRHFMRDASQRVRMKKCTRTASRSEG